MAKMISIDNGNEYLDIEEIYEEENASEIRSLWPVIVNMMDDEAREETAFNFTGEEEDIIDFLAQYLAIAPDDLTIG